MSDITATEQYLETEMEKEKSEKRALEIPVETISKRDKDSGINTDTPIDVLHQERANSAASKTSENENVIREKCANVSQFLSIRDCNLLSFFFIKLSFKILILHSNNVKVYQYSLVFQFFA